MTPRDWIPRPYMEQAIEFAISRPGSGLMLDPGMGKTSITLAVIDLLKSVGEIRKTLVVAPLRVCKTVWPVEGQKWTNFRHLKIVNLCEMRDTERALLIAQSSDVYLINPESLVNVLPLLGKDFDLLVLDESTKFKDTKTKRFTALKKKLFDFKRRMILTGTPVPNGLADLFGQMFVVDFGESLGKFITHFRMEFCYQHPGDIHGWYLRPGSDKLIYKRVANKLMRLDAKDHLAMPELIFSTIEVAMPARDMVKYKALEKDFVAKLEDASIAVFNPAALGTKLRQMANGFIYDGEASDRKAHHVHNEKIDALEELVEEMQGRPLLVAYEFKEDAEMIMKRIPYAVDLGHVADVLGTARDFNAGRIPVLIAHPASAGHGLNLQDACNTVCWYGITWNLEHYIQLNDRVYRQGQEAAQVVIHHIVCKGTKDESVVQALDAKDRTQNKFNQAIKKA